MGRSSRADAAKHREEVVAATSRLLRERGAAGMSVQDLMAAAGLTHGGFYKHFSSKEELVGIATETAYNEIRGMLEQVAEAIPGKTEARAELLNQYLSAEHRDAPGTGCAMVALASDAARAPHDGPLRTAYTVGLEAALDQLTGYQDAEEEVRRRAIADLASMVGALTLARATGGTALSDEILDVVRDALIAQRQ
ncbi:TetR family transcriptional regulator [Micromonospora pisi]|uniref:TetR family transcriptional regulator n=1 Tax=Micromonospora pisi TaxID=589240 RepID=A0A495JES3_9ACTN|nr:TetR/AcrR family transcriptional regulator [Micromonospora pisi]RKR87377.1 TetR family transcriptional regulator [Micromonospora pisi]